MRTSPRRHAEIHVCKFAIMHNHFCGGKIGEFWPSDLLPDLSFCLHSLLSPRFSPALVVAVSRSNSMPASLARIPPSTCQTPPGQTTVSKFSTCALMLFSSVVSMNARMLGMAFFCRKEQKNPRIAFFPLFVLRFCVVLTRAMFFCVSAHGEGCWSQPRDLPLLQQGELRSGFRWHDGGYQGRHQHSSARFGHSVDTANHGLPRSTGQCMPREAANHVSRRYDSHPVRFRLSCTQSMH